MDNKNCLTCMFIAQGTCHRHPPQAAGIIPQQNRLTMEQSLGVICAWPNVGPNDWCGEYISKDLVLIS